MRQRVWLEVRSTYCSSVINKFRILRIGRHLGLGVISLIARICCGLYKLKQSTANFLLCLLLCIALMSYQLASQALTSEDYILSTKHFLIWPFSSLKLYIILFSLLLRFVSLPNLTSVKMFLPLGIHEYNNPSILKLLISIIRFKHLIAKLLILSSYSRR